MTTIYIAGSSREIERIRIFMKAAENYGYENAFDWTTCFEKNDNTETYRAKCAVLDLQAILRSEVLWYVTPAEGKSEGSATELGIALGFNMANAFTEAYPEKSIIVSGVITPDRCFPLLGAHVFPLHAEALDCLRMRSWDVARRTLIP